MATCGAIAPALAQSPNPAPTDVAPAAATPAAALLDVGDRGPSVETLQRFLQTQGNKDLTIDGIYGPQTQAGVRAFQAQLGVPPSGTVTWATWGAAIAQPLEEVPNTLTQTNLLTAAEQTASGLGQSAPSPLWLILMPAIPLLGGGLTYCKRRFLNSSEPDTAPGRWRQFVVSYFPLLGLTVVSGTAFLSYIVVRYQLIPPVEQDLEQLASQQARVLNEWFEQQQQAVLDAASDVDVQPQIQQLIADLNRQSPETQVAYTEIAAYLNSLPEFENSTPRVSLLNSGGIVVFSTDTSQEKKYQALQNTSTYFTAERADSIVPNLYVSPLTQTLQITFATPVVDTEGGRLGVIAVDLDLGHLDQQVQQIAADSPLAIAASPAQESYIVGRASRIENQIISDNPDFQTEYPNGVNSRGIQAALGGKSDTGLYLNYRKVPVIGVYRWSDRHNLALLVEIEQAEVFQPARKVAQQILIVGLGLTAIISILLRRFAPEAPAMSPTATTPPPPLGDSQQRSPE
jgi:peptidoglycan hydrolase-like protein with peptidoglycan-binding domain